MEGDAHCSSIQVPFQTDVRGGSGKREVFGFFPRNAESVGHPVNVIEIISEEPVFGRSRRGKGEVPAWKQAVFNVGVG